MIKEAIVAETGILFQEEHLISMGFDFVQLPVAHELNQLGLDSEVQRFGLNPSMQLQVAQQAASTPSTPSESTAVSRSPEPTTREVNPVPSLYSSLVSTALHRSQYLAFAVKHAMDIRDAVADIYDQLVASNLKPWWILETIPMLTTYQEQSGKWTRKRL
jgi:hypothetical protein